MMYHVMIIEDDPMVASINRQYVEATPAFQADRVFKSGAEALEYLKNHTTDLIILDYYTPLMNGDVFIDRLHAMGKTPAVCGPGKNERAGGTPASGTVPGRDPPGRRQVHGLFWGDL